MHEERAGNPRPAPARRRPARRHRRRTEFNPLLAGTVSKIFVDRLMFQPLIFS
jgi:hypothetical protein